MNRGLAVLALWLLPATAFAWVHIGLQATNPGSFNTADGAYNLLATSSVAFNLFIDDTSADFSEASFSVTNGYVSGFATTTAPAGQNFTVWITSSVEGATTSMALPLGAFHGDSDGAANIGVGPYSFAFDATPPALTLSSSAVSPTGELIVVVATSSEPVSGLGTSSLVVTNGTVTSFAAASSTSYTFVVTPTTDGTTTITLPPGAASDMVGNTNTGTSTLSYYFSDAPVATLTLLNAASSTVASATVGDRVAVLATFSEAVADAPTTTIAIEGPDAATGTMNKVDATHYLYVFTAAGTGQDAITVDGAQDLAGNAQVAASTTLIVAAPVPSGGGGGGGSGSGASAPVAIVLGALSTAGNAVIPTAGSTSLTSSGQAISAATQSGEVLGTQTYRFTMYLVRGSAGNAVTELQKLLIALKFLAPGNAVGSFGPLTQKGVSAYQRARGITQTGTVGPLTRAALNKETISY